jgi:chromosome segregation ATPase
VKRGPGRKLDRELLALRDRCADLEAEVDDLHQTHREQELVIMKLRTKNETLSQTCADFENKYLLATSTLSQSQHLYDALRTSYERL